MLADWASVGESKETVSFQAFEGKGLSDSLHRHAEFEFCYVLSGEGTWQVGAKKGPFRAGSLLSCPPKLHHAWRSKPSMLVAAIVLRFGPAALPSALLQLPEMEGLGRFVKALAFPLEFAVRDRERLGARLRSIDRAKGALRLARFWVAMELIAHFERSQVSDLQLDSSVWSARDLARAEAVKRLIEERYRQPLTRGEAARSVGLEEAAFSRFFYRVLGMSFTDYLSKVRVRHAASLLGNRRQIALDDVAKESGFGSLASLHRQFRRRLGTTPSAYRKAANSEFLEP